MPATPRKKHLTTPVVKTANNTQEVNLIKTCFNVFKISWNECPSATGILNLSYNNYIYIYFSYQNTGYLYSITNYGYLNVKIP
jgi:hypothetical protein